MTVENWYGQTIDKPVREMREYATTVRVILNGEPPPQDNVKFKTSFQFMGYARGRTSRSTSPPCPPRCCGWRARSATA